MILTKFRNLRKKHISHCTTYDFLCNHFIFFKYPSFLNVKMESIVVYNSNQENLTSTTTSLMENSNNQVFNLLFFSFYKNIPRILVKNYLFRFQTNCNVVMFSPYFDFISKKYPNFPSKFHP